MSMISEYIKFGNITLKLNLPQETAGKKTYEIFCCDAETADFEINFCFSDCLPKPEKNAQCFRFPDKIVMKQEKVCRVFYKNRAGNDFYAVREMQDGSSQINILLERSIQNGFWARFVLNTIGIEELALKKGGVVFHSSFIEKDGKAVLFTGPCSIGKSTQADLWNTYKNTPVVNGDKSYIYIENETVYASGLPFSGSSGICRNSVLPLDFIVKLEKAKENTVKMLSKKEAFLTVLKSCYVPCGFGEEAGKIASLIAQKSKVCSFACLPDVSAVETLANFFEKEKSKW
ncbi:MAG: hypothetical protein ACI4W6_09100 [Acutalibacteraceae bacterium]